MRILGRLATGIIVVIGLCALLAFIVVGLIVSSIGYFMAGFFRNAAKKSGGKDEISPVDMYNRRAAGVAPMPDQPVTAENWDRPVSIKKI